MKTQWIKNHDDLMKINELTFPRYIGSTKNGSLWMFADASPSAYGCVAYLEAPGCDEMVLLHSKGKLALKSTTNIPYLELKAIDLLTKWLTILLSTYPTLATAPIYICSDSQIALQWVTSGNAKVAERVGERIIQIRKQVHYGTWHYIGSQDNPADQLTKPMKHDHIA
jgi:Pao retrotransposon peptidase